MYRPDLVIERFVYDHNGGFGGFPPARMGVYPRQRGRYERKTILYKGPIVFRGQTLYIGLRFCMWAQILYVGPFV